MQGKRPIMRPYMGETSLGLASKVCAIPIRYLHAMRYSSQIG
jgi:hypothetical protein